MISLSKIKNKKSFFLQIILFSAMGKPCYAMEEILKGLGSKENPINIHTSHSPKPTIQQDESSVYWKIGWTLLPVVASAALTYLQNKSNEDPEMNELIKKEKQKDIEIKSHPDYPAITLLHQKNDAENKANQNKQTYLSLKVQEAQLLEHHQENMSKFLECAENGSSERERDFCEYMYKRHSKLCKN